MGNSDTINCTLSTCAIDTSNYEYLPDLGTSAAGVALYAIALVIQLVQGIYWKTWSFTGAVSVGLLLEALGYVGRIMSHSNPWASSGFLLQIVTLTIAPAFLAAGIYFCLARVVVVFGTSISRISPKAYTIIFITCDFISLVLQAAGGGIASSSNTRAGSQSGINIMIAGLGFQVFSLGLFMTLCMEFGLRVWRHQDAMDPAHAVLRSSSKFRRFLVLLALATLFIFIRSVYRIIELSQGFHGNLAGNQAAFDILEGLMVVLAVYFMIAAHPGYSFGESYQRISRAKKQTSFRNRSGTRLMFKGSDQDVEL